MDIWVAHIDDEYNIIGSTNVTEERIDELVKQFPDAIFFYAVLVNDPSEAGVETCNGIPGSEHPDCGVMKLPHKTHSWRK